MHEHLDCPDLDINVIDCHICIIACPAITYTSIYDLVKYGNY